MVNIPAPPNTEATNGRIHLEELREEVLEGLKAGKSVDELAETITMD